MCMLHDDHPMYVGVQRCGSLDFTRAELDFTLDELDITPLFFTP